jgi:hypothetical protein
LKQKGGSEIAKKIEAKRCEMKRKKYFLVSQKQAKMERNRMCFASFRFEAKIKKEQKRDTLIEDPYLPPVLPISCESQKDRHKLW